ncbi:light-harvesting protein B-800-850 alpha chain [Rhodoblastus acidophilus]|uniref:Puc1A n=1 Tax=Rhodoblastus acidophilus TaxID=1074 RepID=Q52648_RHOAC|nr:light-harvesting protein [Rhodoblastus acidophilus]MCW2285005.1 light-harvesting protein B-800-850 alpha chain [Rhodoblastus acidophilus]MCW2333931.1 light-harvesting protein B-800-850 alpha chain [Rhodoblastus acidophilus]CAA87713.1 puc1A [Rhodoblastus acidophilus]
MNQGKIWTVVDPAVGIPLLLGSVAVTALLVHLAILQNTTWFPAFMQGGLKKAAAIVQVVG